MENFPGFNKLQGVRKLGENQWACQCPAHEDSDPSFYIKRAEDRWLVHCHAGCTIDEICLALGVNQSELWFDGSRRPSKPKENIDWELEETIVFIGEHSIERPTGRDWERYTRAKLLLARRGLHQSPQTDKKTLGVPKPRVLEDLD